jgi:hypothetical protein
VVGQVAAGAQQMGELGIEDVGRAVNAVAGVGVPWRTQDAGAFPRRRLPGRGLGGERVRRRSTGAQLYS